MTEREQIIAAEAKSLAQDGILRLDFMSAAEDEELRERIDHGQLEESDLEEIFDLAIGHKVFHPATHVAIPIEEYERLRDNDDFLDCLEAAGIDNSTAYEEGCRIYRESKGDD